MKEITLQLEDNRIVKIKEGTTFKTVIDEYFDDKDIVLCELEGIYYELSLEVPSCGELKAINSNSSIGGKVYARTLQFIFIKATLDLFPNAKITIEHSVGKGIFGEVYKERDLNEEDIEDIKAKMKELIDKDLPINKIKVTKEEAINII